MIAITSVLAFYLAWNLGANDIANSMGTSLLSEFGRSSIVDLV